jgi:hypothetical protein
MSAYQSAFVSVNYTAVVVKEEEKRREEKRRENLNLSSLFCV